MQMPDLTDPVFIAKIIDFIVFVGMVVFVFQRVLKPQLEAQQEAQNKVMEDAIAYRASCERSVTDARAALDASKSNAERMVSVGASQAERMHADIRAEAEQHAKRVRAHADGELERERYRVRRELLEETVEKAHAEARDIVKRQLDPAKQRALVDDMISGLERSHA